MTKLVGVHGMAKHQLGRHQLVAAWEPALADGLERAAGRPVPRVALDLAFYGDLFLPGGTVTKSADVGSEAVLDGLDGLDGTLDGLDGLDDALDDEETAELAEALAELVTPDEVAAAESLESKGYTRSPKPLQALLRAVDRRFGSAAAILYVGVLRQVRRFLTDADLKRDVFDRLDQVVTDDCRALLAHSLGSVVAYEYLSARPRPSVELLVTMGSPLGLRMVRDRLDVRPVRVGSWVNIRDLRDPVACAGALGTWWPQIAADRVVDNGGDTHAVERYLSRRTTGQVLTGAFPGTFDR